MKAVKEARQFVRVANVRRQRLLVFAGDVGQRRVNMDRKGTLEMLRGLQLPKRLRVAVWEHCKENMPGIGVRVALDRVVKVLGCGEGAEDNQEIRAMRVGKGRLGQCLRAVLHQRGGHDLATLFNNVMVAEDGEQGFDCEQLSRVVAKLSSSTGDNSPYSMFQVVRCFDAMDKRRRGRVDFDDFCRWMLSGTKTDNQVQGNASANDNYSASVDTLDGEIHAADQADVAAWRRYAMASLAQRDAARQGIMLFLVRRAFAPERRQMAKLSYEELSNKLGDSDTLHVQMLRDHMKALGLDFSADDFSLLIALFNCSRDGKNLSKDRLLAFVYDKHDELVLKLPASDPRRRVFASSFWSLQQDLDDSASEVNDSDNSDYDSDNSDHDMNNIVNQTRMKTQNQVGLFVDLVGDIASDATWEKKESASEQEDKSEHFSDSSADNNSSIVKVGLAPACEPAMNRYSYFENVGKYLRRETIDGRVVYLDPADKAFVMRSDMRKCKFVGKVRRVVIVHDQDRDPEEALLIDYFTSELNESSGEEGDSSSDDNSIVSGIKSRHDDDSDEDMKISDSSENDSSDEDNSEKMVFQLTGMIPMGLSRKQENNVVNKLRLRYSVAGQPPVQAREWGRWDKTRKSAVESGACVNLVVPPVGTAQASLSDLARQSKDPNLTSDERFNMNRPHILVELVMLTKATATAGRYAKLTKRMSITTEPRVLASQRIMLSQLLTVRQQQQEGPLKSNLHVISYKNLWIEIEIR